MSKDVPPAVGTLLFLFSEIFSGVIIGRSETTGLR
jgi:hypothetical protein